MDCHYSCQPGARSWHHRAACSGRITWSLQGASAMSRVLLILAQALPLWGWGLAWPKHIHCGVGVCLKSKVCP